MAVSFEDAVETLSAMFPSWDKSALSELLLSNQNHMERTVETVLMMDDPTLSSADTRSSSNMNTNPTLPSDSFNSSFPPLPPSNRPSNSINNNKQHYRGTRCTLPSDFLRPPSQYPTNDDIMADEQLALMLQNELFQREVRDALGDEFMYNHIRPQPNRPVGSNSEIQTHAAHSNQGGVPDLGILKGLSSVGETAKRTLSQLATKFKSSNSKSGSGNSSNTHEQYGVTNALHAGSGREKEQEMRSLINNTDDDEDGAEVISFETTNRSSGHALDNSNYNTSFNYNNNNGGTI